jgi:hypothetical protein
MKKQYGKETKGPKYEWFKPRWVTSKDHKKGKIINRYYWNVDQSYTTPPDKTAKKIHVIVEIAELTDDTQYRWIMSVFDPEQAEKADKALKE